MPNLVQVKVNHFLTDLPGLWFCQKSDKPEINIQKKIYNSGNGASCCG